MLHPRPQGARENCTWHNFNVVPTKAGYYATVGSYQSGISVFDFSNPAAPKEIAYADPAVLETTPATTGIVLGGDWSTYWHNGTIYQSDIKRGVLSWQLNLAGDASAKQAESHLKNFNMLAESNPQTQTLAYAPDSTMPTITSATEGGNFKVGSTATMEFSCADDVAVASCVGSSPSGSQVDSAKLGNKSFTVTATDSAGNITTKTINYKINSVDFPVTVSGGSVEPTLGLSLQTPPSGTTFGAFTPGLAKTYESNLTASVTSNLANTTLSVYDPATTNTGRLVNGTRALTSPLSIALVPGNSSQQATALAGGPVGGAAAPTPLFSYSAPQTNRTATLLLSQAIASNETLVAGTYSKTLTFTMSTTAP
jgi:hypothetical protein